MTLENYGYLPELFDIRDFTIKDVKAELPQTLKFGETVKLPSEINNTRFCSPMHNQGTQGSCTAQSAVSLFEYMERKSGNNVHIDGSRAFVYYNSRVYAGFNTNSDTGSYIRSTIKSIVMNGIAEEVYFPYNPSDWKTKPAESVYRNALNFKATKYVRLDDGSQGLIERMKSFVNNGYAINFGFAVYQCIDDITSKIPVLPFPSRTEKLKGGHAVIIVGYDDAAPSYNYRDKNKTTGAFLCQNSWGSAWGNKGFFYIPYKYFETQLALDVWTVTDINWVNTKQFD